MNWYKIVKLSADEFAMFEDPSLNKDYKTYMYVGHNQLYAVERQSLWTVLGHPLDLDSYIMDVAEDDELLIHEDIWNIKTQTNLTDDFVAKGRYEKLHNNTYGIISAAFSKRFLNMSIMKQNAGRRKVLQLLYQEFGKNNRIFEYGKP